MRQLAAPLLLAVGLAACAGSENEDDIVRPVHIEVDNQNTATMRIVILRNSTRTRLGLVTSMSTDTFRVPNHLASRAQFRLAAEPVGGFESHATEELTVRAGDWLHYVINPQIATSYVSIY